MLLDKERELMRKHVRKTGIKRLLLMYLLALIIIVVIEVFASLNLHILAEVEGRATILRDVFSTVAILVVAFTVIANIVFMGGRTKADREFHYYFRTRPLLLYSTVAVAGDIFAVFVVHNLSHPYIVFFTALIALNLWALGFAVYSTERALEKNKRAVSL